MEPLWSLSPAQKVARWSSTLRDTIHSGRTPRHNPSIAVKSPNPAYAPYPASTAAPKGKAGVKGPGKPTPSVSPCSASSFGTPGSTSLGRAAGPPAAEWDGLPQSYISKKGTPIRQAWNEETVYEELAEAKAEAEQAKAEAKEAKAAAAEAIAQVEALKALLEESLKTGGSQKQKKAQKAA